MAKQTTTREKFAIKVVKKSVEKDEKESLLTEKRVASLASRHPYLAGLLCSFQTAVSVGYETMTPVTFIVNVP